MRVAAVVLAAGCWVRLEAALSPRARGWYWVGFCSQVCNHDHTLNQAIHGPKQRQLSQAAEEFPVASMGLLYWIRTALTDDQFVKGQYVTLCSALRDATSHFGARISSWVALTRVHHAPSSQVVPRVPARSGVDSRGHRHQAAPASPRSRGHTHVRLHGEAATGGTSAACVRARPVVRRLTAGCHRCWLRV